MSEAHFVDSSALLKRYVQEVGTVELERRCFADPDHEIFVSALTYAEAHAAFTRLLRDGALTAAEHEGILASFERDWRSFVCVEFGPPVRRRLPVLARDHGLRGADLVQLASAVHLRTHHLLDLIVVCDVRLANAAVAEGLPLFNPEIGA